MDHLPRLALMDIFLLKRKEKVPREDGERNSKRPHLDMDILVKSETNSKYGAAVYVHGLYMIQVDIFNKPMYT